MRKGVNEEMFNCLIVQRDKTNGSFLHHRLVTHFVFIVMAELQTEIVPFGELQVLEDFVQQITALGLFLEDCVRG